MPVNQNQKTAIQHGDGPMMVLAGPGSGKTTVITRRVCCLIEEQGVDPGHILVVTFTNAAAREMKERFLRICKNQSESGRVSFGTFHSVFFRILKLAYGYESRDIVGPVQQESLIRSLLEECGIQTEDEKNLISELLGEISQVKEDRLSLDHYYARSCGADQFRKIYKAYHDSLRNNHQLDFEDMMVMCYELFLEREDILNAWRNRFRYILIDEFQDINWIQYEVVKLLAAPRNNLFIVGDDDQSIYRFRGARPELMLGFPKDYPHTARIVLDINYRSTADIVEASQRLICHNQIRFNKQVKPCKGRGKPVLTLRFPDFRQEVSCIVEDIRTYLKAGYHPEDMAVLYRTNSLPRPLIEKLMEYNLPFFCGEEVMDLYHHWICKDLMAYFQLAEGDRSRSLFLQIMNRPNRYLKRELLTETKVDLKKLAQEYGNKEWMQERIMHLEHDLNCIRSLKPVTAIRYIRKAVGYDGYLDEYARYRGMDAEELKDLLSQLEDSAAQYDTLEQWKNHIREYEEKLSEKRREGKEKQEGVALMTMHRSKGLEFPIVWIMAADEEITPYKKAGTDQEIEEERRMFYVAMTRAGERLQIYSSCQLYGREMKTSRFIREFEGDGGQTY